MIFIALGANLAGPAGTPRETLSLSLSELAREGVRIISVSRWFQSTPVPKSNQPDFINGVALVETMLGPVDLLVALHRVEDRLGRVRSVPNAARCLDLDLIDYDGRSMEGPPTLPHPRAKDRLFVLEPLRDLAPEWRHPTTGDSVDALIAACPPDPGLTALPVTEAPPWEPVRREALPRRGALARSRGRTD
ncbi:MAG: 2-amino-4-hydroxy-6-hydroxymethyldihydropteridine diphosphokinase [Rhodospirillum sp.]|nr:2-amino-4-hydroxy-6-hydroxymethyldihydropteridine diphosphokinase [Rhodospirillum sp.]MCF8490387.1 2-amino-4-hydroxy-6-hydroxymethyldihydropteridine diphosphokinase [Rhodospirillum sp.]MCF8501434.1 2-amino-4-hydroxy-6-hydroxymethyldihydropteridine diphosphokinase [Rhodospirillum sp.]